jgi:hypothetical protein
MRPSLIRVIATVTLALALAACGGHGTGTGSAAGSGAGSPKPTPSHVEVVRLQVVGGFAVRGPRKAPPRLVVYGDGRTVADGKQTVHLPAGQLDSLLSGLRQDLDGLPATVHAHGAAISDASTVSISVRSEQGTQQTVTAMGLSAFPQAFPDRLAHAWQTLSALTTRTQQKG